MGKNKLRKSKMVANWMQEEITMDLKLHPNGHECLEVENSNSNALLEKKRSTLIECNCSLLIHFYNS